MIFFVAPERGTFCIRNYLSSRWGQAPSSYVQVRSYESLARQSHLPAGTWVFQGCEQLTPAGLRIAQLVARTLERAGQRVLNHPLLVASRYALLTALYECGINDFRAVWAHEYSGNLRFPVFVREESQHSGSLSPLLHTDLAVRHALTRLRLRGYSERDLLVVEYCNTEESTGLFKKYAAYNVNGAILARSLNVSKAWMVKSAGMILQPEYAHEATRFVTDNPHAELLHRVFAIARIQFGRIDYGILAGRIQAWEINTNPSIEAAPGDERSSEREEFMREFENGKAMFYERFHAALAQLDEPSTRTDGVPVAIPPRLLAMMAKEEAARARSLQLRAFIERSASHWAGRTVRSLLRPLFPVGADERRLDSAAPPRIGH